MVCFFAFSSAQDQERSARWTKHHSVYLFCCQPSAWTPPGKAGAAGPSQQSEQRAWGTTYPTGPRSQNPFFKRTRAESQRRPGQLAGTDGWRAVAPLWEQTRAPAQPGRQPEPQPQPGGWEPLGPLCPLSAGPACPGQTGKTSPPLRRSSLAPGQVGPSGNSGRGRPGALVHRLLRTCLCRCAGSLRPRLLLRAGSPVSSAEYHVPGV